MNRIDCSNIFNFMSEWERRRIAEPNDMWFSISKCLNEGFSLNRNRITYEMEVLVEELQKWSDEHAMIARKEKFKRMCDKNGFGDFSNKFCTEDYPFCKTETICDECKKYWNELVDEH